MQRSNWRVVILALGILVSVIGSSLVSAQGQRVVTVKELFALNHRLEVDAGTEVVFGDPHFERVWFSSDAAVAVKRTKDGFAAVFQKPGTYRGRFTVAIGHGTAGEAYPMTVVVKAGGR